MSIADDVAKVREAVAGLPHLLDGTSAAFERIAAELERLRSENEDAQIYLAEAAEARERAEGILYEERMGEGL